MKAHYQPITNVIWIDIWRKQRGGSRKRSTRVQCKSCTIENLFYYYTLNHVFQDHCIINSNCKVTIIFSHRSNFWGSHSQAWSSCCCHHRWNHQYYWSSCEQCSALAMGPVRVCWSSCRYGLAQSILYLNICNSFILFFSSFIYLFSNCACDGTP